MSLGGIEPPPHGPKPRTLSIKLQGLPTTIIPPFAKAHTHTIQSTNALPHRLLNPRFCRIYVCAAAFYLLAF